MDSKLLSLQPRRRAQPKGEELVGRITYQPTSRAHSKGLAVGANSATATSFTRTGTKCRLHFGLFPSSFQSISLHILDDRGFRGGRNASRLGFTGLLGIWGQFSSPSIGWNVSLFSAQMAASLFSQPRDVYSWLAFINRPLIALFLNLEFSVASNPVLRSDIKHTCRSFATCSRSLHKNQDHAASVSLSTSANATGTMFLFPSCPMTINSECLYLLYKNVTLTCSIGFSYHHASMQAWLVEQPPSNPSACYMKLPNFRTLGLRHSTCPVCLPVQHDEASIELRMVLGDYGGCPSVVGIVSRNHPHLKVDLVTCFDPPLATLLPFERPPCLQRPTLSEDRRPPSSHAKAVNVAHINFLIVVGILFVPSVEVPQSRSCRPQCHSLLMHPHTLRPLCRRHWVPLSVCSAAALPLPLCLRPPPELPFKGYASVDTRQFQMAVATKCHSVGLLTNGKIFINIHERFILVGVMGVW
ncbi:hypothetical protein G2W53_022239 [Senna tora]|uniref:Uncharacterized protein n=1 Tax=Senna tora TaxID=362788 RepID=A0A834TPB4_9FABA|nr:hypothetical protein G2W53_022239 [Senna tora]